MYLFQDDYDEDELGDEDLDEADFQGKDEL